MRKPKIEFLLLSLILLDLSGCASIPSRRASRIENKAPWMKLYRYPYRDVFDSTLAVLKNRDSRMVLKYSRDGHYILAGYGPIMLSYAWYEVYHFEEISPYETLLELGYVISGPLTDTIELKDEKLIKEPIFTQIEVFLIVQREMRKKYRDFSILNIKF